MEKKELLEYFVDRDILELCDDFSDDGDGELELTDCGDDVAELIVELVDKAREEGKKEQLVKMIDDSKLQSIKYSEDEKRTIIIDSLITYLESWLSKLKE